MSPVWGGGGGDEQRGSTHLREFYMSMVIGHHLLRRIVSLSYLEQHIYSHENDQLERNNSQEEQDMNWNGTTSNKAIWVCMSRIKWHTRCACATGILKHSLFFIFHFFLQYFTVLLLLRLTNYKFYLFSSSETILHLWNKKKVISG